MKASAQGVALVTGAGRGLGGAIALALGEAGFDVVVHFHRSDAGATVVADRLRGLGRRTLVVGADLSQSEGVELVRGAVVAEFGGLDVLVNNAGVYVGKHGLELSDAEWREGLDTTVTQTFLVTRALLPLLRASGRGRIINIGDSGADRPGARDLAWSYHVGKTGVWILTRSLAAEEAAHGVAANMVSPGFLENSVGSPGEHGIPAGRKGAFDDVTGAVLYLAREASAYVTGSNVVVGGGWNLR
jgi:3-oxoacyl-[acyl-carrier protein] reductase